MMTKEIAYLHPAHTARALVLVYLCFSLPVVGLFFFVGFFFLKLTKTKT